MRKLPAESDPGYFQGPIDIILDAGFATTSNYPLKNRKTYLDGFHGHKAHICGRDKSSTASIFRHERYTVVRVGCPSCNKLLGRKRAEAATRATSESPAATSRHGE